MRKSSMDERYKLGTIIELSQTSLSMGIYIPVQQDASLQLFSLSAFGYIFQKLNCYNDNCLVHPIQPLLYLSEVDLSG